MAHRAKSEIAACRTAVHEAKARADVASVGLQARLTTARASGDGEAEHVWRERESRQAAGRAEIDASKRRIDAVNLRLRTCENLASTWAPATNKNSIRLLRLIGYHEQKKSTSK